MYNSGEVIGAINVPGMNKFLMRPLEALAWKSFQIIACFEDCFLIV